MPRHAMPRRNLSCPKWREVSGEEQIVVPRDVVKEGKQLMACMAENGCLCARERRMRAECSDGCEKAISAEEAA